MKMKRIRVLVILILFLMLFMMTGCNSKNDLVEGGGRDVPSGFYDEKAIAGSIEGDDSIVDDDTGKDDTSDTVIKPRQLTASALFDNDDYDYYKSLLVMGQEQPGEFYSFYNKFKLPKNRIKLEIKNSMYAKVSLMNGENVEWVSYTDKNGICYLFNDEERESYNVSIVYKNDNDQVVQVNENVVDGQVLDINSKQVENNTIQLMFIIDTTGSMGDEIEYLKAEIKDVIEQVKAQNNNCNIYTALMFYRDKGDEYVTRYFDFTSDINSLLTNLGKQSAAGGGDFEEAIDVAFSEAVQKQWLTTPSTKIVVHVADAPCHDKDVNSFLSSVKSFASQGIRIINVASSGINKQTEYLFRSECIYTNGCYAFLTNDSGIGGEHIDATVKEKLVVEYLNKLLIRVISGMHSGEYSAPIYYGNDNQ